MAKWPLLLAIISALISCRESLKILGITPLTSPSHHVWVTPLMKELANRGHSVYLASIHPIFPDEGSNQNITSLVFEGVMDKLRSDKKYKPSDWTKFSVPYMSYFMYEKSVRLCDMVLKTEGARKTLELVKNVEFDVIIQDVTVMQCMYGIWEMARGKPAIVGFVPLGVVPWVADFVGGTNYPAFKPYVHSAVSSLSNIWRRTLNTLYYSLDDALRRYYYMPVVQAQAEKFIGRRARNFLELEKDVSVVLVNSHSSYDIGVPLPQNVIEIGGMHVENPRSLPKDLQMFMDGADHGIVVIALGTNVNCTTLGSEKLETIVSALSKLRQRVLWKFEGVQGLTIPKNVMIREWLPQNDVIAHKNVKVLWSHAGRLSVQEAIWHGVPVIGMPFFMDQRINVQHLVSHGVGVHLDFETLTTSSILQAFDEVFNKTSPSSLLNNFSLTREEALLRAVKCEGAMCKFFARNMKLLSKKYRDRPMPPMDLAIWHIENSARYPYAVLACPGRFLNWIQRSSLDVYTLLTIVAVLSFYLLFYICQICFRCYGHVVNLTGVKLKRA